MMHSQRDKLQLIIQLLIKDLQTNMPDHEPHATYICGSLWLGNKTAAHDRQFVSDSHISHIINATEDIENKFNNISYTTIRLSEKNICDQRVIDNLIRGAHALHKEISDGKNVLVHCKRGHHRSASIIVLYLMIYHNMTLIEALYYVKSRRPISLRRDTCMLKYLINYELSRSFADT